ncbi:hypothetical protein [Paraburkholderia sp. J63]|uniref:hypothetical protein n=1 Tax=Paraburkholderia sp. J63 TaxID=2805434 RepID=UPI002ABE947C|nr:hypothetical protein [Paraburkholderia sp. J63]
MVTLFVVLIFTLPVFTGRLPAVAIRRIIGGIIFLFYSLAIVRICANLLRRRIVMPTRVSVMVASHLE